MPFDNILQMGRTPKITEDVVINPFALINNEVANSCIALKSLQSTFTNTETGIVEDVINVDYTNATPAYQLEMESVTSDVTSTVIFDLQKVIYIDKASGKWSNAREAVVGGSFGAGNGGYFEYSIDGSNWIEISNNTALYNPGVAADTNGHEGVVYNIKARYFRFRRRANVSTGTYNMWLKISSLRITISGLQY